MKSVLERIRNEPALVVAAVAAVISLLLAFGLSLSEEQIGAIMAVVVAVLGFVTRSQVTPTRSVAVEVAGGKVVTGAAIPPAGRPVDVVPTGENPGLVDERGVFDSNVVVTLAAIVIIVVGLIYIVRAL